MRVYSAAFAAAAALAVATAQTSTATSAVSTSSGSSDSVTASAGSVSCVFRYSMPTATNLPSGLSTSTSQTSTGSEEDTEEDASMDMSGSVGDSSEDSSVDVGSDSASSDAPSTSASKEDTSVDSSSSSSGSSSSATTAPTSTTKTPASTTRTPSATTKTPTATTKTPSATTKTPSATTQTPSTSTSSGSSTSATTSPTTSIKTDGSNEDARRLMGAAGEAETTTSVSIGTNGVSVSADASGSTGTSTSVTTAPTSTTATPSSTTKTPSSTTKTPSATTSTTTTTTTAPTTTTATTTGSSSTTGAAGVVGSTTGSTTIEFSCDSAFYSAWTTMDLTCEGTELDVEAAASSTECLIYSGASSGTDISDLSTCMSVCRFPACNNGTWDYSADDGISSDVYANLDFITLMTYAGLETTQAVADTVQQPFSNLTFATTAECEYTSDNSFSACQCAGVSTTASSSSSAGQTASSATGAYAVPVNKGLGDSDHWADGTVKSTVDKAGIASTTIGSSAATVSVVAGGVMSVASGVVGGTSAGVASGVSAAASVGITMAAVDICQFSIMLNQMNVDARPRFMENMGKKMAPAAFTFLPFGKSSTTSSDDSSSSGSSSTSSSGSSSTRRLTTGSSTSGSATSGSGSSTTTTGVQGMEKYASLIGVDPDMLFYLAVAGIGCMVAVLFGAYGLAMGVCYFIVEDFPAFSRKWLDKAIGVLMMILILSEYVVGATAMYQICYCIDNDAVDISFFLAIFTLLVLAFGTILYGVLVIKNNEDELRDLGTKDHFDKKFHARYGPLYDEHSFEGRFFFAPKLLLALLCGMTTGMVWIQGLWQIIVLIAFHIAFLLYLEIKQPYPTAFVQKTSSFVIIIKISALFLSFFLLSSATSFTESIPDDLREGVAFAIVGLQVLVLVCLMIRQVYIFYRTWKLKRDGVSDGDKAVTVQTTNAREGSEAFFALGGEPQYYGNPNQSRANSLAVLGDSTPKMQAPRQYAQETPANRNNANQLRGLHPQNDHGMTRTHTVVQHHRNNEVDL